jgi:hypothetical protein
MFIYFIIDSESIELENVRIKVNLDS